MSLCGRKKFKLAEGMGFEPMREVSPPNRLAGGRTRPLCDPSYLSPIITTKVCYFQTMKI